MSNKLKTQLHRIDRAKNVAFGIGVFIVGAGVIALLGYFTADDIPIRQSETWAGMVVVYLLLRGVVVLIMICIAFSLLLLFLKSLD